MEQNRSKNDVNI